MNNNRVGLLLIATGKYDVFLKPLLDSVDKFFFPNERIDIYIFTDKPLAFEYKRMDITYLQIPHKTFPYATLYRYKYFDHYRYAIHSQYIFYSDVDMRFVGLVGEEILGEIVAVQHPGFYKGGWGSANCNPESLAYLPKEQQHGYVAGGFQGGETEKYLRACNVLNARIQDDERRGVMAEWHDETHWNFFIKTLAPHAKILDPSYCYPESWKLPFPKRLLALDKNHAQIRS